MGIGTAYPIARDRILTARHVLAAKGETIDLSKIELTWFHLPKIDGKRIRADPQKVKIAWDGGDTGWDAVILECPFPEGVSLSSDLLSRGRPETDARWQSLGFAATGEREEGREPQPLKGAVYACADKDRVFHLGIDDAAAFADDWKGASGSPVFVGNRIMGIIVRNIPPFEGRRIEAIPMFRLLQTPEFRNAVGLPERDRIAIDPARFQAKIVAILKRESSVLELWEEMRSQPDFVGKAISVSCGSDAVERRAEHVVKNMFNDFDSGKRLLQLAMDECRTSGDETTKNHLHQVAYLYFPACFSREDSEAVLTNYMHGTSELIDTLAASVASIEFRMAAIEGRPADFDPDQTRDDGPVGRRKIHDPPPFALEAICTEEFREAFAKLLFEKAFSNVKYKVENYAAFRKQIDKQIKIGSDPKGCPYIVLNDPGDKNNSHLTKDVMAEISRELRSQYKNLFITHVSDDPEIVIRELEYLDWFWKTFSKK